MTNASKQPPPSFPTGGNAFSSGAQPSTGSWNSGGFKSGTSVSPAFPTSSSGTSQSWNTTAPGGVQGLQSSSNTGFSNPSFNPTQPAANSGFGSLGQTPPANSGSLGSSNIGSGSIGSGSIPPVGASGSPLPPGNSSAFPSQPQPFGSGAFPK
jgi:hypothetical protein